MTEWLLAILKDVAMAAAVWLLWTLRNAFTAGWNVQKFLGRFEEHKRETEKRLADIEARMDKAGAAMSDFASDVQGLPERMREEFMTRREADLILAESKVDRQRLWDETRDIWKVVNRREDGKGHR